MKLVTVAKKAANPGIILNSNHSTNIVSGKFIIHHALLKLLVTSPKNVTKQPWMHIIDTIRYLYTKTAQNWIYLFPALESICIYGHLRAIWHRVVLIVDAMMTYQQGFSQTFLLTSIFDKRLSLTAIDWGLGAAVGHSSPLVFKKPFHTSLDDLIFSFFRSLFSFCTDPLYHWWLLKVKKE